MSSLPIDFEAKVKQARAANGAGYPTQISAGDLMRNFVFAAGEFDADQFDVTDGTGQESSYTTQKISLKSPLVGTAQGEIPFWSMEANENAGGWQMIRPATQGGFFYWNTEANGYLGGWKTPPAPLQQGELLFWNKNANNQVGGWELVTVSQPGAFLVWNEDLYSGNGGWEPVTPTGDGTMIYYSPDDKKWQMITPTDNSVIYFKDKAWQSSTAGSAEDRVFFSSKNSEFSWSAGLPDGTAAGELLRWNSTDAKWEPFGRGTNQNQLLMWGPNGWQAAPTPPATGKYVFGSIDGALGWIATEEC